MSEKTGAFDALLADIQAASASNDQLAKAMPVDGGTDADDANIAAAAGEGDGDADDKGGKPDGDADDKPMAKSLKVTLEDGSEVEAIDGSELIKSLSDRMDASEASIKAVLEGAMGVIKQQGDLIKSLTDKVGALAGQGKGRKAVVSVVEKPAGAAETLAKSHEQDGLTGEQFLAKALEASKVGRITARDVSIAEAAINMGVQPPEAIVRAVIAQ